MNAVAEVERSNYIGGSDAPVITGVSRFKQPLQLYKEKRGELPPEDLSANEAVHFGLVLEDVVAQEYARRRSLAEGREVKVRRVNRTLYHKEFAWMGAHIDRDVLNEDRVLECKTADKWTMEKWGDSGTDEVPEEYIVQTQHYLAVTGTSQCDLAVLIGGNEFRLYHIKRDQDLIAWLIQEEREFWRRVTEADPPPLDYEHRSAGELLKRVYPGTNRQTIALPAEAVHWHKVRLDSDAMEKRYAGVKEAATHHLRTLIGENAIGTLPDGTHYARKQINRAGYTVEPTTYVEFRHVKPKKGKGDE